MGGLGLGEWLGIFALAVGLMALPTAFQIFWGRPEITFEFSRLHGGDYTNLFAHLYNHPVKRWLLRALGVKRDDAHFTVVVIINLNNKAAAFPAC